MSERPGVTYADELPFEVRFVTQFRSEGDRVVFLKACGSAAGGSTVFHAPEIDYVSIGCASEHTRNKVLGILHDSQKRTRHGFLPIAVEAMTGFGFVLPLYRNDRRPLFGKKGGRNRRGFLKGLTERYGSCSIWPCQGTWFDPETGTLHEDEGEFVYFHGVTDVLNPSDFQEYTDEWGVTTTVDPESVLDNLRKTLDGSFMGLFEAPKGWDQLSYYLCGEGRAEVRYLPEPLTGGAEFSDTTS